MNGRVKKWYEGVVLKAFKVSKKDEHSRRLELLNNPDVIELMRISWVESFNHACTLYGHFNDFDELIKHLKR